MRLLIASAAALLAVTFAAPSFAQDETPAAVPVPTAKPKPGTSAYCKSLKSASSRSACLKKMTVAKAQPKATPKASTKTTSKTKAKKPAPASTPKQADSAQLPPPAATPTAPAAAPTSGTVAIPPLPPLPSKTI